MHSKALNAVTVGAVLLATACGDPTGIPESEPTSLRSVPVPHSFVATATASTALTRWRALSQAERVNKIIDRALRDSGKNVKKECKPWVQDVIFEASGQAVTLPLTVDKGMGSSWYPSPFFAQVARLQDARRGDVVQMIWKNAVNGKSSPHTFILTSDVSVPANGNLDWSKVKFTVVESNFTTPLTVATRQLVASDFLARVGRDYTIYRVTAQ